MLFRTRFYHHRDYWYPCRLLKYSRMTLSPQEPIFKPKTLSRIFTVYRAELLTEMDVSTSQDIIDLTIPAKTLKVSLDPNSLQFQSNCIY